MSENIPSGQPGAVSHRVEVTTTDQHGKEFKRFVEGDDTWVAASLRALADKLDPPKLRPGLRQPDPGAGNLVRRGPGGAGLVSMSIPPPSGAGHVDPMSTR